MEYIVILWDDPPRIAPDQGLLVSLEKSQDAMSGGKRETRDMKKNKRDTQEIKRVCFFSLFGHVWLLPNDEILQNVNFEI